MMIESNGQKVLKVLLYVFLILMAAIMLLPFLWMLSASLKEDRDVFTFPIQWIPAEPRWQNYSDIWTRIPLLTYILNTVKLTIIVTLLQLFTSSFAAYAFSKLRFKGKNALFLGYDPLVFDRKREKPGKTNLKPSALIEENREEINTYRFVGKHTPPSFIWHTYEDTKVLCSNALLFASALNENSIPFELHIFQHGEHGLYTATDLTMYGKEIPVNTDRWIDMCSSWLRKLFDF